MPSEAWGKKVMRKKKKKEEEEEEVVMSRRWSLGIPHNVIMTQRERPV